MSSAEIRALPLPTLSRVTFLCLQWARSSPDFLAGLRIWLPELRALQRAADRGRGLGCVLWYVAHVAKMPTEEWQRFLERELGPSAEEAMRSIGKELLKQVEQELIQEARSEGRAEGRAELLRRMLTVRFGKLSARVEQRLRRATPEQLDQWGERLLHCATLREVFATG